MVKPTRLLACSACLAATAVRLGRMALPAVIAGNACSSAEVAPALERIRTRTWTWIKTAK
jgi:hypothetical protein